MLLCSSQERLLACQLLFLAFVVIDASERYNQEASHVLAHGLRRWIQKASGCT